MKSFVSRKEKRRGKKKWGEEDELLQQIKKFFSFWHGSVALTLVAVIPFHLKMVIIMMGEVLRKGG